MSKNQTTSSLAGLVPIDSCVEYDDQMRPCRVKLYTRPIGGVSQVQQGRPSSSNQNEGSSSSSAAFHHWALVFNFGNNDRILTFEAAQNENGILEAYRSQDAMSEPTNIFDIGTAITSPKKLLVLAKNHPHNGNTYWASYKNCQEWVKEYARMIDKRLLEKIEELTTCKQITAGAVGLAAILGLGYAAYKLFSNGNNKSNNDENEDEDDDEY